MLIRYLNEYQELDSNNILFKVTYSVTLIHEKVDLYRPMPTFMIDEESDCIISN